MGWIIVAAVVLIVSLVVGIATAIERASTTYGD